MAVAAGGVNGEMTNVGVVNADVADIEVIIYEAARPQTVSIVTFGKTGTGKSTLASAIANQAAFQSKRGWKSDRTEGGEILLKVGQVDVKIIDLRGMKDSTKGTHDEKTLERVGEIVANDSNGVLIVCIDMYERVDESTMETFALLHQKYGQDVWKHVVIALTKADKYEEHKWDGTPVEEFAKQVEECKNNLKEIFTSDDAIPSCRFGMTGDEFDRLRIPVIPTSELNAVATKRMKQVGYGHWFDELIVRCCQREQGTGILQIHSRRLSILPPKMVTALEQEVDRSIVAKFRRAKNATISGVAYVLGAKFVWKYYCKQVNWARFDPKDTSKKATKAIAGTV